MKEIGRYKDMVEEVGRVLSIFADYESSEYKDVVDLGRWTTDVINSMQVRVMNYAGQAAAQIKDELIGDGDEAKYRGRLRTAFYELGADPNFAPSFFPCFDEALFELPSKENPDRNRATLDALAAVYGSEAKGVMVSLQAIAQWANMMVQDVAKMLDDVCSFVGYTPGLQEQQQEEQELKDLLPEKLKSDEAVNIFQKGIDANLIEKKANGLYWKDTNQLLAYFAEKMSNMFSLTTRLDKDGNKTIDWKTFEKIFNMTGLKDAKQNWMRLNTRFEPTGYEKVDALM